MARVLNSLEYRMGFDVCWRAVGLFVLGIRTQDWHVLWSRDDQIEYEYHQKSQNVRRLRHQKPYIMLHLLCNCRMSIVTNYKSPNVLQTVPPKKCHKNPMKPRSNDVILPSLVAEKGRVVLRLCGPKWKVKNLSNHLSLHLLTVPIEVSPKPQAQE